MSQLKSTQVSLIMRFELIKDFASSLMVREREHDRGLSLSSGLLRRLCFYGGLAIQILWESTPERDMNKSVSTGNARQTLIVNSLRQTPNYLGRSGARNRNSDRDGQTQRVTSLWSGWPGSKLTRRGKTRCCEGAIIKCSFGCHIVFVPPLSLGSNSLTCKNQLTTLSLI